MASSRKQGRPNTGAALAAAPSPLGLLELSVRDFAIVDQLRLSLEPGLNALTGETGAGKSILIDALGAVLGDRIGPHVVRAGAERALIEATFQRPETLPDDVELEADDDVLILSREIAAGGRSSARLNGRAVPLSVLQSAGRALVDIHGQTEHHSLLRPATHLQHLDRFAGLEVARSQLSELVREWRRVRQEIQTLHADAREAARRQDLLRFQVEEIDSAGLSLDEEKDLLGARNMLANAERLRELATAAKACLAGEGAAIDSGQAAAKHFGELVKLDPQLTAEAEALEAASAGLQETSRALSHYLDSIEVNPTELQRVEDRLDLIRGLKRKYGETIAAVLDFGRLSRQQLNDLLDVDARSEELRRREEELSSVAGEAAERLTGARKEAASRLEEAIELELHQLNMPGARFEVHLAQREGPDRLQATGLDDVEFFMAANPGEPVRPLAAVASGGEASRMLLALKSVFSAVDDVPVLVFDEIEVGVGARGGHVIGEKLRALAMRHQVLCITHLAPVAALANAHFRIRKLASDDRTRTQVDCLTGDERVEEVAEMLAGRPISDAARQSARELLDRRRTLGAGESE